MQCHPLLNQHLPRPTRDLIKALWQSYSPAILLVLIGCNEADGIANAPYVGPGKPVLGEWKDSGATMPSTILCVQERFSRNVDVPSLTSNDG